MYQVGHVTDGNVCHFSSSNLVQFVMFVVYNLEKNRPSSGNTGFINVKIQANLLLHYHVIYLINN